MYRFTLCVPVMGYAHVVPKRYEAHCLPCGKECTCPEMCTVVELNRISLMDGNIAAEYFEILISDCSEIL